ncbi:MAG: TIGR01777 family oxidoreductase [Saprospiraceae bacterium]|nr:TIGR01777 family oxidoreductase [Saprospiraceae bacterium]
MHKTVLLTGGTGLVGRQLQNALVEGGHQVHILSRSRRTSNSALVHFFQWDVAAGTIEDGALKGVTDVIHLAGASIAERWTSSYKKTVIDSRVESAQLILKHLKANDQRVESYISASASGIYQPNTGGVIYEDFGLIDKGFLGEVCTKWEAAADEFDAVADRIVKHRIGIVLDSQGGALAKMLPPIKFGLAPYFGSGNQYYSWIHIQDLVNQFVFSLENELEGVYNAVTAYLTQKELNQALAGVLGKKALALPAPKFALQLAMGEMHRILTDSLQLSNQKIKEKGFQPGFNTIEETLINLFE